MSYLHPTDIIQRQEQQQPSFSRSANSSRGLIHQGQFFFSQVVPEVGDIWQFSQGHFPLGTSATTGKRCCLFRRLLGADHRLGLQGCLAGTGVVPVGCAVTPGASFWNSPEINQSTGSFPVTLLQHHYLLPDGCPGTVPDWLVSRLMTILVPNWH